MPGDDPTPLSSRGRRAFLRPLALVALVAVIGLTGVAAVSARHGASSEQIVTTAGRDIDSEAAPPTGGPSIPSAPISAPVPTVPPATAPTTVVRATTTTTRPRPTTTRPTAPAPAPTTPVTATTLASSGQASSGQAMVTLRNSYSEAVQLKINGQTYELGAGQQLGPVAVTPAPSGNDIIELRVSANLGCGEGDADGYFAAGHRYLLTVATGPGGCPPSATSPRFTVTPA